jgi:hypothetical protein
VNLALVAVAIAVGGGAVIAVSSRDPRAAFIGLAIVLIGASFLVAPLPPPATLGVRIVGGLLCLAILRLVMASGEGEGAGSPLGWPAEAMLAIAAAVGGAGVALALTIASVTSGSGSAPGAAQDALSSPAMVILATSAAIFAVSATPSALGRPGFGRTVGLMLITVAVTLLRVGFAGAPNDLEQVAIAVLLVGGAAGGVGLARAAAAQARPGARTTHVPGGMAAGEAGDEPA